MTILRRLDAHKLKIARMLDTMGQAATEANRTKPDKTLLKAIERIARASIGDGG